jgi:hypothetical protein
MTFAIPHHRWTLRAILFLFGFALQLSVCLAHEQVSKRNFTALSRTAQSITGNISIGDNVIKMARASFKVKNMGTFNQYQTFLGGVATATIYKLSNPRNPAMLSGNKICAKKIRWYVIYQFKNNPGAPKAETCLSAFQSKEKPLSDAQNGFCAGFCYFQ